MAEWETVVRRRKDPGSQGNDQEGQKETGVGEGAHVGSFNRFTGKIRAEFAVSSRIGKFNVAIEAKKLFTQMIRVDPDIVFKSDSDGRITFRKISEFPAGENKFKEFFTVTPHMRNDGTGKVHVTFQTETKQRIMAMKRDSTFFNYIRENKIWITEHKYKTHALQSIGWITFKSPELTNKPMLESDIGKELNEYIKCAIDEGDDGIVLDGRELTPTLEICGKRVVHVVREGDKKVRTVETQALVIRCERSKAMQLNKLLYSANIDTERCGTFVPYQMAKTDSDVFEKYIHEHNKYVADIAVIPVFGLHWDVIETIVDGRKESNNAAPLRQQLLLAKVKTLYDERVDVESLFLAIEPTQRTDDLGKWMFLTKKHLEETANKTIDNYLLDRAVKTPAYKNHLNDNDSFKQGIRRTNRPSNAFTSYTAAMRASANPQADSDDEGVGNKYTGNYKKRKQLMINYDEKEEFPALPTTTKTTKKKQGQQTTKNFNYTTNSNDDITVKQSSTARTTNNNNASEDTSDRNAIQAQLDWLKLEIMEMKALQDKERKEAQQEKERENHNVSGEGQVGDLINFIKSQFSMQDDERKKEAEERKREAKERRRRDESVDMQFATIFDWIKTQTRGARKRDATDELRKASESMEVENERNGDIAKVSQYESILVRRANSEEVAEATRLSTQNE